jgi:hypothetical protein
MHRCRPGTADPARHTVHAARPGWLPPHQAARSVSPLRCIGGETAREGCWARPWRRRQRQDARLPSIMSCDGEEAP